MPLSNSEARSHSVLETSLTELAFTFFFILAIFASWKISETTKELHRQEIISTELSNQVSDLTTHLAEVTHSLEKVAKFASFAEEYDPDELFIELSNGRRAAINLEKSRLKQNMLQTELEKYSALINVKSNLDAQIIAQKMIEFEKVQAILSDNTTDRVSEQIKQLRNSVNDISGQNTNLRNKLEALGNGLDHPPCWANLETGSIEYVFDIVINEASLAVYKGWHKSRNEQAIANINITKAIGEYPTNALLWNSTAALFEESKLQKCRHFVRVYDHSESKSAFKSYLLGIENHFYKYLSYSRYE